jgi:hypothetical protein
MCLFERPIIAIDFDGVIRKESKASIKSNTIMPDCKKYIKKLFFKGCDLILWTCRSDSVKNTDLHHASLDWALEYLIRYDIHQYFYGFNVNSDQLSWDTYNKIYADYYLDDLNLGGFPGWKKAYEIIMQDEYFKKKGTDKIIDD